MTRRWWILVAAGMILGIAAVRLLLIQGMIAPIRIAGPSMAPALRGEHLRVVCKDCRFPFHCDARQAAAAHQLVCPNCGFAAHGVGDGRLVAGDRVLVDRWTGPGNSLDRWDLIAFRERGAPRRLAVKRIVGLPHETVALHDGDLYVDGRIVRKSLAELRAVAVGVHDDKFRPTSSPDTPRRWQGATAATGWQAAAVGYRFRPPGESPSSRQVVGATGSADNGNTDSGSAGNGSADNGSVESGSADSGSADSGDTDATGLRMSSLADGAVLGDRSVSSTATRQRAPFPGEADLDWLTYRHWRCFAAPFPRADESPVLDHYGYNQHVSRELRQARDLLLVAVIDFPKVDSPGHASPGPETPLPDSAGPDPAGHASHGVPSPAGVGGRAWQWGLKLEGGGNHFVVQVDHDEGRAELRQNGQAVAQADLNCRGTCEIEFAVVDRRVLLARDGRLVFSHPFSAGNTRPPATARPVGIGARGGPLRVIRLRLFRDLHYLDPGLQGVDWNPGRRLGPDEWFVLGDNVPVSRDSRHWQGGLTKSAIAGRVVANSRFTSAGQ